METVNTCAPGLVLGLATSGPYAGGVPAQRPEHRPFRERRRRQRYKRWTAREDVLIAALREEGKSWRQIARRLHRSAMATRKRAHLEGLADAGWVPLTEIRRDAGLGVSKRNLEDLAEELGVVVRRVGGAQHRVVSPADAELLLAHCSARPGEVGLEEAAEALGYTPKHLAKRLRRKDARGRRLPGKRGWVVDAGWLEEAKAEALWMQGRLEKGLVLPVSRAAEEQGYCRRRLPVPAHRRLVHRGRHYVRRLDLQEG